MISILLSLSVITVGADGVLDPDTSTRKQLLIKASASNNKRYDKAPQ